MFTDVLDSETTVVGRSDSLLMKPKDFSIQDGLFSSIPDEENFQRLKTHLERKVGGMHSVHRRGGKDFHSLKNDIFRLLHRLGISSLVWFGLVLVEPRRWVVVLGKCPKL